ncbi:hypothetical protein OG258_19840 [Streptomyces mirabilis]|uniref:hypothetical protein n=1 Tax=Streptomyces mirabilis TaxID=68239 RepID=UPI002E27DF46|nr:hypothetical protein [Streptomyces mirabilis]
MTETHVDRIVRISDLPHIVFGIHSGPEAETPGASMRQHLTDEETALLERVSERAIKELLDEHPDGWVGLSRLTGAVLDAMAVENQNHGENH